MDDPAVSTELGFVPQGISADLIATLDGFSRDDVDAFALRSQQRAAHAAAKGHFRAIVPVRDAAGNLLLDHDEHVRPESTLEGLANLPPAFAAMGEARFDAIALSKYPQLSRIEHVHTAGNSSGITSPRTL